MSNYEVSGTIRHLGQLTSVGAKGAQKREVVLTIGDKYPQTVAFEAFGDKTVELDESRVGDEVTIAFELHGREWRKSPSDPAKFFTSLGLRSIKTIKAAPAPADGDSIPF